MAKPTYLVLTLLALSLALGAGWFLLGPRVIAPPLPPIETPPSPTGVPESTPQSTIDTSDWKTYRNEEIGIEFEYPDNWGGIEVLKEVGCVDYYSEKMDISENPKSDCLHITLKAQNIENGLFLSSEGLGFTRTEIPKGLDWRFRLIVIDANDENFCLNNPFISIGEKDRGGKLENCMVSENLNKIPIVSGTRFVPFMEKEKMTVYFIRSPHPIFYDIVISAQNIKSSAYSQAESDIKRLVNSIRFIR